ncbi:MAG: tyrosine-type recombinase/integrase [Candidatus Bathycorpusculaceae bacterium]
MAESVAREEKPTREGTKPDSETIKGLMAQYIYWLEKEGYYEDSRYPGLIRQLVRSGANLYDPESVKATIARQHWKDGTKILAVYAYDIMAKHILKIEWTHPKYVQEEILPFIPEETELDQLISACKSRRMAAYLQTLKETFGDPGEVLRLRWVDFSDKDSVITINRPVKGHSPRQLKISSKLVAMLNGLPKTSERIFPTTYRAVCKSFQRIRQRVANNTSNPRIRSIKLSTFRHWGATMTYHYTKNILLVQKLLGHKNIKNTLKYTQLVQFKDDEFDVATAENIEEAKELLAAGFDYITEKNNIMLFRRPKRFNG